MTFFSINGAHPYFSVSGRALTDDVTGKMFMTVFFTGPSFIVHILIATMINAFLFPLIMSWSGSLLYSFLISVLLLCIYGAVVRLALKIVKKKN